MLSEHGYTVGRYVSLEQAIADSDDAYYQALLDSTYGWHDGTTDPWPWLGYFTRVIAGAYAVFADRAAAAQTPGTKQQRVREHILRHALVTFRLADIRTALPGVSDQTIRLVLEQLRTRAGSGPTEPAAPRRGPGRISQPRAGVLVLLDTPKSTTQLTALTGQGLGSVGRHLKVLLTARLVGRRRAGRSVLYHRTAAGQILVEAQLNREEAPPGGQAAKRNTAPKE
jgi:DNA-binding transcriptional ArsR family regulator